MSTPRKRSQLQFFMLVFVLSIPFWVAGALTAQQLLPALPVSALGFLCPGVAALILVYRKNGLAGVWELLKRSLDFGRIVEKAWLVPMLFFEPVVMVLSYVVMRLTGVLIPIPQFSLLPALASSLCSSSQPWAKSWVGRVTRSTRCKRTLVHFGPVFSWG